MRRIAVEPRSDWHRKVESLGFHFDSADGRPYWDESVCYVFTAAEVDALEAATYALDDLCLKAVDPVIARKDYERFNIPPGYVPWIERSWDWDELAVVGRFDLAFNGRGPPVLLEYNADTPTSLLEASVVQWYWLRDMFAEKDQFNSIHERLIEAWKAARPLYPGTLYFSAVAGDVEDYMTVQYLRDTATQAGLKTDYIDVGRIGWDDRSRRFVDMRNRAIESIFKLYPWEWMFDERFGPLLPDAPTRWLEAPWKTLLNNKAILVVLYELFPDCPFLLPASFEPIEGAHVRKPLRSREGQNVQLIREGRVMLETSGPYGPPYVYQAMVPPAVFDGNHVVVGSWLINGWAAGVGLREDGSPVTNNSSRFVPHYFE